MSEAITQGTIVTGAEFRNFYKNHWPEGWYVEDMPYAAEDEQGNWILPDDARKPLSWFGVAIRQSEDPGKWEEGQMREMHDLYADVMGISPSEVVVSFKVSIKDAEALKAAAEKIGARII